MVNCPDERLTLLVSGFIRSIGIWKEVGHKPIPIRSLEIKGRGINGFTSFNSI
jgi:hypothetical protein